MPKGLYSKSLGRNTVLLAALFPALGFAQCIPMTDARAHVGANKCVAGKVVKVSRGPSGTTFLNFCADYRTCPFQVVVFSRDLRHVGDVRQLEGRIIEIQGQIKEYNGRPEIILRRAQQLRGEAAKIPPLPRNFDVEKPGSFSAGRFGRPKASRKPTPKRQTRPIETEDPAEREAPE